MKSEEKGRIEHPAPVQMKFQTESDSAETKSFSFKESQRLLPAPPEDFGEAAARSQTPGMQVAYRRHARELSKIVEVPFTRTIKVQENRQEVIQDVETKQVPVKRIVEEIEWQEVDEEYTEIIEVPSTRKRIIWVPQEIEEQYMELQEVKKVRQIRVPLVTKKELLEFEPRDFPVQKVITIPEYRVESIPDVRRVEVNGIQEIECVCAPGEIAWRSEGTDLATGGASSTQKLLGNTTLRTGTGMMLSPAPPSGSSPTDRSPLSARTTQHAYGNPTSSFSPNSYRNRTSSSDV